MKMCLKCGNPVEGCSCVDSRIEKLEARVFKLESIVKSLLVKSESKTDYGDSIDAFNKVFGGKL